MGQRERVRWTGAAVRALLGVTAHPGGVRLSRTLLDALHLPPGARVADVACGRGSTVVLLAERGHRAVGIDVDPTAVRRAAHGGARVARADALALPIAAGALDAVVCECALSTTADPAAAIGEMARILRGGGRLGITDVTVEVGLDPHVRRAVAGLTTARPRAEWVDLLAAAGLEIEQVQDRRADALALLRRLRRRLVVVPPARRIAGAAEREALAGRLGYGLIVARRP